MRRGSRAVSSGCGGDQFRVNLRIVVEPRAARRVERGEFALNAQIRAANLLARQKQLTSARSSLQNLRRLYPSEAVRLYRAEGDILVRSEQLDEAMAIYSDALESKPQNTDLLYARAMVAARGRQHQRSRT